MTPDLAKKLQVGWFINAPGDDVHTQRFGEGNNGVHHGGFFLALLHAGDQGAIDFEGVNSERLQMTERRVARAEVIDHPFHPQRLQRGQCALCVLGSVHRVALGHVQL